MTDQSAPERVWFGRGPGSRIARALLRPAEVVYGAAVAARGLLYARGVLRVEPAVMPVLSIGNLTVGGTGKTPVSAWAAATLLERGARPAIVLRGYGDDEPMVHERLNPDVPVITTPKRAAGIREARERGCDVAVLDDAFQHRRISRDADWVLVSADQWTPRQHLLPAGPWREPLSGVRRASLVIVTRKAAAPERAHDVLQAVSNAAPGIPAAIVRLDADSLRAVHGEERLSLDALAGAPVLLVAGIGDPAALQRQLEVRGATVRALRFGDHHAFTPQDIARIAALAVPGELVVCTLKDAVKIGPGWPRAAPALWYVSQRVAAEEGARLLSDSLDMLLRTRRSGSDAAPSRGPYL